MDELMENEIFCSGVAVGINLHQQRVIAAHKRNEALIIGDELFYIQSEIGRASCRERVYVLV